MFKIIKNLFPDSLKSEIFAYFAPCISDLEQYSAFPGKLVFVFLAGFYQNLGDMAITYAQIKFLQQIFPGAKIIPIASTKTYESIKTVKRIIRKGDLVTISGGGNMSDLYLSLENARLFVIKSFPNNRIISFPQTIYFSSAPLGHKSLQHSVKIYSGHKNLTLFAREKLSFEKMAHYMPDACIKISPDIVLSLDEYKSNSNRKSVLCCFRKDMEQSFSEKTKDRFIKALHCEYPDLLLYDTVDVKIEDCQPSTYVQTLENFWSILRQCKVVITDRLHCMIFCAITGTPCIALDNSNHKISEVYNYCLHEAHWLKMLYGNDPEIIFEAIKELEIFISTKNILNLNTLFFPLSEACLKS